MTRQFVTGAAAVAAGAAVVAVGVGGVAAPLAGASVNSQSGDSSTSAQRVATARTTYLITPNLAYARCPSFTAPCCL